MQTINIHSIKSIELGKVSTYKTSSTRSGFSARRLTIIDENGNKIDIELFSKDPEALTLNAEWNQDQSITV